MNGIFRFQLIKGSEIKDALKGHFKAREAVSVSSVGHSCPRLKFMLKW